MVVVVISEFDIVIEYEKWIYANRIENVVSYTKNVYKNEEFVLSLCHVADVSVTTCCDRRQRSSYATFHTFLCVMSLYISGFTLIYRCPRLS